MIRTATLIALMALVSASPAFADSTDLSGRWSFTSKVGAGAGCTFQGTATVVATEKVDKFDAVLLAEHNCPDYYHFIVEQTADISVKGNQVTVLSTIQKIIKQETEPGWEDYSPDNFALTIQKSGNLFGSLNGNGASRWVRQEEGIS